jgi:hypothetical protein
MPATRAGIAYQGDIAAAIDACPQIRGEVRVDPARQASRAKDAEEKSKRGTVIVKRLISMLAAGLLAAATLLAPAGAAASAGTTAARRAVTCMFSFSKHIFVEPGTQPFFVGMPNNAVSGSTVRLKSNRNSTTDWNFSSCSDGSWLISIGSLAMTSRSLTSGAAVTVTSLSGSGFASQRWFINFSGATFTNEKTNPQALRVRNGGPIVGQTVTTGLSGTNWQIG